MSPSALDRITPRGPNRSRNWRRIATGLL